MNKSFTKKRHIQESNKLLEIRHLLKESTEETEDVSGVDQFTFDSVLFSAKNFKLTAEYKSVILYYKLEVDTAFYDGPVALVSAWKDKEGNFKIKDNTDKVFKIPKADLLEIAKKIKQKASEINVKSPLVDLFLTKTKETKA